jgi:hypothetical protein
MPIIHLNFKQYGQDCARVLRKNGLNIREEKFEIAVFWYVRPCGSYKN